MSTEIKMLFLPVTNHSKLQKSGKSAGRLWRMRQFCRLITHEHFQIVDCTVFTSFLSFLVYEEAFLQSLTWANNSDATGLSAGSFDSIPGITASWQFWRTNYKSLNHLEVQIRTELKLTRILKFVITSRFSTRLQSSCEVFVNSASSKMVTPAENMSLWNSRKGVKVLIQFQLRLRLPETKRQYLRS